MRGGGEFYTFWLNDSINNTTKSDLSYRKYAEYSIENKKSHNKFMKIDFGLPNLLHGFKKKVKN